MASVNLNYWDCHPGDRVTYRPLFDKDKSKNKKDSSEIMWALNMLCSNSKDNPLKNMTREERLQELETSYVTQEQIKKVLEWEEKYAENNLSYLQKRFRFYQRMLEQREEYMASLSYEKSMSIIEDMWGRTKKIWDDVLSIKKLLDIEEQQGDVKGGREESAAEKGLL